MAATKVPFGHVVQMAVNSESPPGGRMLMVGCEQFFQESWATANGDASYERFVQNIPRMLMGGRTGKTIVLVQSDDVDLSWYSANGGEAAPTVGTTVRGLWEDAGFTLNVIDVDMPIDWSTDIPALEDEGDIVFIGNEFYNATNTTTPAANIRSWVENDQGAVFGTLALNPVMTVAPFYLYSNYAWPWGDSVQQSIVMQDTAGAGVLFDGVSALKSYYAAGKAKVDRPVENYPDPNRVCWRGYRQGLATYTYGMFAAWTGHADLGAGTDWNDVG